MKLGSADREVSRRTLEALRDQTIVPFWFPACVDTVYGGYRVEHDGGKFLDRSTREFVSQSRVLWFTARLIDAGHRTEEARVWARHGMDFLRDHFWDAEHGGFFWQVDRTGAATETRKHLYGQAFGLYALSEYAISTGDPEARSMARDLFQLLEDHAHDSVYGGYREFHTREWREIADGSTSLMDVPAGIKQLNTHVHLLEALTRYAQLADDEISKQRLAELVEIQSRAVVRTEFGSCTDWHHHDWRAVLGPDREGAQYGHDVENVWLLIEASRVLGEPSSTLITTCEMLFSSAVRYGWDRQRGGLFAGGPLGGPADRLDKIWWVQAEALVGALVMFRETGRDLYWEVFEQTLRWIVMSQVDWTGGEWFFRVDQRGRKHGPKGSERNGAWKTPYHSGRAVLRCLELL